MKQIATLIALLFGFHSFANNDKYRLIITSDPATSITVAWNQISGSSPTVYYDTVDHGTNHTLYANTKGVDRVMDYRSMMNNFARLTGLTPNTNYYFLIRDSEGNSQRFWFRTAPDDLSRLSFIAGGDSRNNRTPRQNANLLVSKLKPHGVLFGGDMTDDDTPLEWQNWFDDWQLTTAADGRMIPILPARGNHEGSSVIFNLFDTPTVDSYYAVTFGDNLLRAYTLNSEISVTGTQLTWLENDLASHPDVIWKSAQYHKPMTPHTSGKSEGTDIYNAWAQLFYEQEVRLVVDCDSHTVKTTWPVIPSTGAGSELGFIRDDNAGTVYAGEGCWGAPLRTNNDDKVWTRNSGSFNQFKLIFVDETKIELRTIRVDNAVSVGEVSNTDPFTLPAGLDVWNPSEGDVVTILANSNQFPRIAFKENTPLNYSSGTDITLDIEVTDENTGITKVDFYVEGSLVATDNVAPYSFTNSYATGMHNIEARATDVTDAVGNARLSINIGSFSGGDSVPIVYGTDDAEEDATGDVNFSSSDLEMVNDNGTGSGNQTIGMYFRNINVPSGATITSAYIQFRSDEANSVDAELLISAEDAAYPKLFEDISGDISTRTRLPGNVNWQPAVWTGSGQTGAAQRSPDVTALLQQIVDKCDWVPGNNAVFIIEGTGASLTDPAAKRVADSYNGSASNPPTLVYTFSYDAGQGYNGLDIAFTENTPTDYTDGTNIDLPIDVIGNGYGITSVDFYVDGVLTASDNTAPYNFTNTYADGSYMIEAVATDACEQITKSFYINVGTISGTYSIKITDGNDDVEETESGNLYTDSSDLEMVYDSFSAFGEPNGYQKIGLRFPGVNIPYGATITNAYIQFRSDEVNSDAASYLISAEDTGDAQPFFGNPVQNASSRPKFATTVAWNPPAWTATGQTGADQRTPDLAALLQQAIDRCDWQQGNSVMFMVEGTGVSLSSTTAKRVADSFEGSATGAPTLVYTISYDTSVNNSNLTEFTGSGWTNGTPNANSRVVISSDYNTQTNGNIEACSLTVTGGSKLTIAGGTYIDVGGDITVDGSLVINHEGSLVQADPTAKSVNNGTIKVEITTPFLLPRDFMVLGSPMSGESRNGVFNSAYAVFDHKTANFYPNPDVAAAFPGAVNFADDTSQNGKFWNRYFAGITPGRGYLVKPQANVSDGNTTYDMTYQAGTLNNGDVTFQVNYNTTKNDSPNILANPYPSAIWADDLIMANSMINEVYFWEHITSPRPDLPGSGTLNFSMEDISMYNLTGGTPASSDPGTSTRPNGYISTGQGFGIKANASGTAVFTNSMRRTGNNNTLRLLPEEISTFDRIWLKVRVKGYAMQNTTLLGFSELTTAGLDPGYDSRRLATLLSLYSHLEDGSEELGIQAREPLASYARIPLGFSTSIEGRQKYAIEVADIEGVNLENTNVFLLDNETGRSVNLKRRSYVFASSEGTFNNRFTVIFKEATPDKSLEENIITSYVYPNPSQNVINVYSEMETIHTATIFSMTGTPVLSRRINSASDQQFDLSNLPSGMYFMKIETDKGTVMRRFIKQ